MWFSHDGESFQTHETKKQAEDAAEAAMKFWQSRAVDNGWDDESTFVMYGKVTHAVRVSVDETGKGESHYLEPIARKPAVSNLTTDNFYRSVAEEIAKDLLTVWNTSEGTECTRMQMMLMQADGTERNMGGRIKASVVETIIPHIRSLMEPNERNSGI